MSLINIATGTAAATIRTGAVPPANADIVTMIDLRAWQVAGRLEAGKEPDGLGYSPLTPKP